MKRLFLMSIIFVISIAGCFAYTNQEMIYGTDIYEGKAININAFCYGVRLDAYWYISSSSTTYAFGNIDCGDTSGVTIGRYYWRYDGTSPRGSYQVQRYGEYLGTVLLYIEAIGCYGQAVFTWET